MVTYLLTSLHIQFSSLDFNGSMNDFFRDTKNEKRKRERERERKNGLCNCINVNFKKYRFLSNHQLNTLRGQLKECLNSY